MEWTRANHEAGKEEGWYLYKDPGQNNKQWLSCDDRFSSMKEVHNHIVERAIEGSPLHLKVLALFYVLNNLYLLRMLKGYPAEQVEPLYKTISLMARMAGTTKGEL